MPYNEFSPYTTLSNALVTLDSNKISKSRTGIFSYSIVNSGVDRNQLYYNFWLTKIINIIQNYGSFDEHMKVFNCAFQLPMNSNKKKYYDSHVLFLKNRKLNSFYSTIAVKTILIKSLFNPYYNLVNITWIYCSIR